MSETSPANDPTLKSWVESANRPDSLFPIQNLPFGVFSSENSASKRVGVAIGDQILDLSVIEGAGLLPGCHELFNRPHINTFMEQGSETWTKVRDTISALLRAGTATLRGGVGQKALLAQDRATLHLPVKIGGYTDFYSSRQHATNVGSLFRGADDALPANWLHMPIGYNGRAGTVVVSGTPVRRPLGQIKGPDADADSGAPIFTASRKLDMEVEIGAIVGTASAMGEPISIEDAGRMIFGYVLLNDWSARDIQAWEYRPLGPFLSKAFATTVSPWVVMAAALEPFRVNGPLQEPRPLPYLRQYTPNNFDIVLEASLRPQGAPKATTICRTNFKHMYWSGAQQLAHHAIGGCAMGVGDLLGSGTVSGRQKDSFGSLLELTRDGAEPLTLDGGGERTFIEDGDTLTLTGWAQGDGYRIGFGAAAGKVLPAPGDPGDPGGLGDPGDPGRR